jgi:hypothetical protein
MCALCQARVRCWRGRHHSKSRSMAVLLDKLDAELLEDSLCDHETLHSMNATCKQSRAVLCNLFVCPPQTRASYVAITIKPPIYEATKRRRRAGATPFKTRLHSFKARVRAVGSHVIAPFRWLDAQCCGPPPILYVVATGSRWHARAITWQMACQGSNVLNQEPYQSANAPGTLHCQQCPRRSGTCHPPNFVPPPQPHSCGAPLSTPPDTASWGVGQPHPPGKARPYRRTGATPLT